MCPLKCPKERTVYTMTKYDEMKNTTRQFSLRLIKGHEKASTLITIEHVRQDYERANYIHIVLWSYCTSVVHVYINASGKNAIKVMGLYSATTRKHISWFANWLKEQGIIPMEWNYYTFKASFEKGQDMIF